jgi:hypothetical protein
MTEERATLPEINNAYVLGKDDGYREGFMHGMDAGRSHTRRAYRLVTALCIVIALLFILWAYTV